MLVPPFSGRIVGAAVNGIDQFLPENDVPSQYRRKSGGILQINPCAIAKLEFHRQISKKSTEAGGILLGRYIKNSADIVIDFITEPSDDECRTRLTYFRTSSHHQAFLDYSWNLSEGVLTYLGDWHTHPQCRPVPSSVDLRNWHNRLEKDIFTESLFFLILGMKEIRIWEGKGKRTGLEELERVLWDINPE